MDQSTFTQLTGITPSSSQSARFGSVAELSGEALEEMLGWPLDPTEWENQYIEIGKTKDEWWTWPGDISEEDLDPPDTVQGQTRLYDWNVFDTYLHIDPATAIHAVKLVKGGITYKTFDADHYSLNLENGAATYGRYVQFHSELTRWLLALWPVPFLMHADPRYHSTDIVQVAIDADWAFGNDADGSSTLPTKLQKVWADLIYYELDVKGRDIKSQSMLSHSYTRNPHADPMTVHAATICKYVGPRGTSSEGIVTA